MKKKSHLGFIGLLAIVSVVIGTVVLSQQQQATLLRIERDTMRLELSDIERLRAENVRLRGQQIPAAELEALRADHAALPRLRAELEAMQRR